MKKLLCCLLLTVASLPAAQVEDWLKSGLLHPDLIASVREQLALTEEQQTKLNSQLSDARAQAEPLEQAVQEHFKAAALLIERCCPRRIDDEVMAGLLELMFCRTIGLLHPVLYFPSYPWRDVDAMRRRLFDESRIEIPVTQHGGRTFVRLSVQGYNTQDDLERLLAAPALAA